MSLDILIVAGIAFTQLFVTVYAVWVSVTDKRITAAFIIGVVGALGVVLTVWGAVRAGVTQQKLEADINELKTGQQTTNAGIQHIESTPRSVTVNPQINIPNPPLRANVAVGVISPGNAETINGVRTGRLRWLVLNELVQANIPFTNTGSAVADAAVGWGRIYIVPSDPMKADIDKREEKREDEKLLEKQFRTYSKTAPKTPTGTIPNPNGSMWFTARSERVITQPDIEKLAIGGELLFLFFVETYKDATGSHYIHGCQIAQPPAFNPEIWQFCDGFQDHR
jgi:hypothetical protein